MHRKRTPDDYEEAITWYISRTNKEISFSKNRAFSIYKLSRTEYKKLAHFQNGVSILGEFFFRTGCQFGVPGGTYPPKKYPSAPPRDVSTRFHDEIKPHNKKKKQEISQQPLRVLTFFYRKPFLSHFLQSPGTCFIREHSNFISLAIQG